MPKIIFCFAGTGGDGAQESQVIERYSNFPDDVIRVYLAGCQHPEIGGNLVTPNLDLGANNIRDAFEGNILNLEKLRENLGDAIARIEPSDLDSKVEISEICLEGFSRGGVSCFATAKALDDLGLPIDIIANQPVPGGADSIREGLGLYGKYQDLSECENIRTATTILSSISLENGVFMDTFFQQMVAKFSPNTTVKNYMMPYQSHTQWMGEHLIPLHINNFFATLGYANAEVNSNRLIKNEYLNKNRKFFFTPKELSQKIFGADGINIEPDPIFKELIFEQAARILAINKINVDIKEDYEKAKAINIIFSVKNIQNKKEIIEFILDNNNPDAKKFVDMVIKVQDSCRYIEGTTKDEKHKNIIFDKAQDFKKIAFEESYNFLKKPNPSEQDKNEFADEIIQAEKEFQREALEVAVKKTDYIRIALKTIFVNLLKLTDWGIHKINKKFNDEIDTDTMFHSRESKIMHKNTTAIYKDLLADAKADKFEEKEEKDVNFPPPG